MAQQVGFNTCRETITSYKNNVAQEFTIFSVPINSYKRDYLVRMLSKTNNTNR